MKKTITVILKQTHVSLGKQGQILKVSPGYLFNYLMPKNLAEIATKGKIKHITMFTEIEKKKQNILQLEAKNLKNQIEQINKITLKKKIGDKQQIFGSVNEKEIINEIYNKTGYKLNKKQINMPEIKYMDIFNIALKIIENESCYIKLQIIPENI